jgi:hypothetical protein
MPGFQAFGLLWQSWPPGDIRQSPDCHRGRIARRIRYDSRAELLVICAGHLEHASLVWRSAAGVVQGTSAMTPAIWRMKKCELNFNNLLTVLSPM